MAQLQPFDALASEYDARFTHSLLGRTMRQAVWGWLDRAFKAGDRVLELGCGTGEDAVHLAARGVSVLATDASPGMLAVAREKIEEEGATDLVDVRELRIEGLDNLVPLHAGTFDGALSNFGGLNCVGDLPRAARALAALLRPGGRAVLCMMGRLVPWEWVWFLARGRPSQAFRRLASGGAPWRGLTIHYPSVNALRNAFAADFTVRRVGGVGMLLPPPYAEAWARKRPGLIARLNRWERRAESWPLASHVCDHYLIELVRA